MLPATVLRAASLLALILCSSHVLAAEPASHAKLDWLHRPTGADVARYYPEKASASETPGRAIIDCDVTASGLLDHCRVVDEAPTEQSFGEAALKLGRIFRLNPKTVDLNDPARNRVIIPIVFGFPGKLAPPIGYLAGQNSVALTVGVKPGTKSARDCATKDQPDRLCVVHALEWKEQPWLAETLPMLEGVDMETGTSVLQCGVTAKSSLAGCIATDDATPAARKAMFGISEALVAPERTIDGAPVGEGPVLIPFDWSKITPLARRLRRP